MQIDLNSDLGEGCGADSDVMPWITSANISCGFHAGTTMTALEALRLAAKYQVVVGAHPGYQDRENFGRRELHLPPEQLFAECVYQIGALQALGRLAGTPVRYLKPHGALYHQANWNPQVAEPVLAAAEQFGLAIVGLPGSILEKRSRQRCPFLAEGFADRRYLPDGSLVPRDQPDAFVHDPKEAVQQVEWLIRTRGIQTLCVHGDNPRALDFVKQVRKVLVDQGFQIRSCLEKQANHD